MTGFAKNAASRIASGQWGEGLLWAAFLILLFASLDGFALLSWRFEQNVTAMLAGICALAAIGVRATRVSGPKS